jgi:uncharacterized membrane protein YedE/YeeE
MEILYEPWPWYVAGPVIGLSVPILLLLGNKRLGISSTLRQICAATFPANLSFLRYDWKKEIWNLYFAVGILIGGYIGGSLLADPSPVAINPDTVTYLKSMNLNEPKGLMPQEIFNWQTLATSKGFLMMIVGGFLVGFGTRYARGCTSGHGIMGIASLQWPSLLATASFFLGGIIFSYFVLPYILTL